MNTFNFSGLNLEQRRILTQGGWDAAPNDRREPAPTQRAVQGLIARGLLASGEATYADKHGVYTLSVYSVPSNVASAWAAWLSSEEGDHAV